jgi:hypothetical protein
MVEGLPFATAAPRQESLAALLAAWEESHAYDLGEFVDTAPAGEKNLDRKALDQYVARFGPRRPRGAVTFLEADLFMTTTGLFYVSPRAFFVWHRYWRDITVSPKKLGRRFARVTITDGDGNLYTYRLSARAAENLLALADHYGARA